MTLEMLTEPQPEIPAASLRPESILIIEDDAGQREALQFHLSRQGFQVETAPSGRKGLSAARRLRPQIALIDLGLPDMSGLEVCEALSDDPATWDLPVILLSGDDQPDVVRRARQSGCRFFLRKPYDPNALLALVLAALADA